MDSNPSKEDNPEKDSSDEADAQTTQTNPNIPRGLSVSTPPPAKARQQITYKIEKTGWEKFKDAVEMIGIAVLIVYTIFTIKMYFVNKKAAQAAEDAATAASRAVDMAKKTMMLDERAWVAVPAVNGVKPGVGQKMKYTVHFINTGKSPARNVVIYQGDELLAIEQQPNFSKETKPIRLGVLSPGSERTFESYIGMADQTPELNAMGIEFLKQRTLSIHGRVTYDDIFGCHHWITYAAYMRDDWSGYSFYPKHNDTDSDQPCDNK